MYNSKRTATWQPNYDEFSSLVVVKNMDALNVIATRTQDNVEESHDQDTRGHAPTTTTTTRDDNATTKHGNKDATLTQDVNA
ncbi:hypothetical protein K443DRAFT_4667 [Laccaria amethystina LaAM-08-1]|uniref:Unplaced genomic scaffold K443scaffold_35, whole genome shotgun sequence n=1 Tax=Laccaria amethystina LaAM-08-1 TaxID=1095629 RepID=A0A0C9WX94_9AGAR|nr:hypothetical protein K443DRAFT_4667 [Laccaria amethystina LaAM-08-1]